MGDEDGPPSRKRANFTDEKEQLAGPSSKVSVFYCPICYQALRDPATITCCGFSFCSSCIRASVDVNPRCPHCDAHVADIDMVLKSIIVNSPDESLLSSDLRDVEEIVKDLLTRDLPTHQLDEIIVAFQKKKEYKFTDESGNSTSILSGLLNELLDEKTQEIKKENEVYETMKTDAKYVAIMNGMKAYNVKTEIDDSPPSSSHADIELQGTSSRLYPSGILERVRRHKVGLRKIYEEQVLSSMDFTKTGKSDGAIVPSLSKPDTLNGVIPHRDKERLEHFAEIAYSVTKYDSVEKGCVLNYDVEIQPQQSIVSSLEFDKDGDLFVVAGVTKKIKIFSYDSVVNHPESSHYPISQLSCKSKISNVSWNPVQKNYLCSSDYEGTVNVWDTTTTQTIRQYSEHEKRCWTVNFNNTDHTLLASGSDDSKVKIWSLNSQQSVNTIDAKVNVCCVCFSPTSRNELVFGSADHSVHLYDIRQTGSPVTKFEGHMKAVSYVMYLNSDQVVSASTDSSLRLWSIRTGKCLQVFKGHTNEKNFVGLSSSGDNIMCGSENGRVYFYNKHLPTPILDTSLSKPHPDGEVESFISSVCWKKNENVALVANSSGRVQFLKLV